MDAAILVVCVALAKGMNNKINHVKSFLCSNFDTKDLDPVDVILGVKLETDLHQVKGWIWIYLTMTSIS